MTLQPLCTLEIVSTPVNRTEYIPPAAFNTSADFSNVIPQETYVFMWGNNLYLESSGYPSLEFCDDDLHLLRNLLTCCLKIKPENISSYTDLTKTEFLRYFTGFLKSVPKTGRIIIYYSGHGDSDGSLVFTGGRRLEPVEWHLQLNTFSNDTVLILDACYTGNQETPLRPAPLLPENPGSPKKPVPEVFPLRENCLRIYATLAHQAAKELKYDNPFFRPLLPFYRDVLGITEIPGNSFFMAMIAHFFAAYSFSAEENASFYDLVTYITRKSHEYSEVTAALDKASGSGNPVILPTQLPKILPSDKKIPFRKDSHSYLVYQKKADHYRPQKNYHTLRVTLGGSFPLSDNNDFEHIFPEFLAGYTYNFRSPVGTIGLGAYTGYMQLNPAQMSGHEGGLSLFSFMLNLNYATDFDLPFYITLEVNPALALFRTVFDPADSGRVDTLAPGFLLNIILGAGFNPSPVIGLSALLNVTIIPFRENDGGYTGFLAWGPQIQCLYNLVTGSTE